MSESVATTLPGDLTRFVGRDTELDELHALFGERRLVTLTGPGGCGKSRLAARVCHEIANGSACPRDGVQWVDLGSLTDTDLVVRTVADALGLVVVPGDHAQDDLVGQLYGSHRLVCLDTCEHLLDAAASLVDSLLRGCPDVAVFATSREPLGVPGETVFRVPSLTPLDAAGLFVDRAELVAPGSGLDTQEAEVRRICSRLDGIPLAIELAAAWVSTLAPGQIADGLDDGLQLLGGGPRTALSRHQTMAASLDWSHQLLPEAEQRVFRRLAVFSGSFTGEAGCAISCPDIDGGVAEAPLALLRRLVEKSLVVARAGVGEVRYRLLDVVRQYAHARLSAAGETEATRDRHLSYYETLASTGERGLDIDQDTWRMALDREHDEIHAALQWALGPGSPANLERGRRMAATMARQWFIRGQSHEGIHFLQWAIELEPAPAPATLARLHCARAMLGMVAGRVDLIEESVTIAARLATDIGDGQTRARAAAVNAYPEFFINGERCFELATEATGLAEEAADPFAYGLASMLAGYALIRQDLHVDALGVARAGFERSMISNDRFCAAFALGVEMFAHLYTGDVKRAVALGDQVMTLVTPLGDFFAHGSNAANVALAQGMGGDIAGARRSMESVVRRIDGLTDVDVVGYMFTYGLLALWAGEPDQAFDWFTRGVRLEDRFEWTAVRCYPHLAAALRRLGRLDEAADAAARAVEVATAVNGRYVLAEAWDQKARLVADQDPAGAFDLHHQALALRREFGLRTFYPDSLDALGALSARFGSAPAGAVRALAASDNARRDMGYPRTPADEPDHLQAVDALRAELGDDEFEMCWAEGARQSLDDAVAAVSRGRGPHNRPHSGWSSLTPTELEVAGMVADGLTNPEIGQRLFISRSTVKSHLSHVYAKLAISSRAELASMVSRPPASGEDSQL